MIFLKNSVYSILDNTYIYLKCSYRHEDQKNIFYFYVLLIIYKTNDSNLPRGFVKAMDFDTFRHFSIDIFPGGIVQLSYMGII